jgi:signal transduction histidine kinase/DNA-binding response OmpR family regulator
MRMTQGYANGAVDYIPTPVVPAILRAKVQVFVELFQMRRLAAQQAEERAKRALAEVNAQRSAFMAEAGAALARSLDMDSLQQALVRAPLPFLADACVLYLAESSESAAVLLSAWDHGNGEQHVDRSGCPWPWLTKALQRAAVQDQLRLLDPLPSARTPAGIPDLEQGNAVILPLNARQNAFGALALLRRAGAAPYGPEEITLAREFVSRAGIAVENARLVQGIQEAHRRKDEFLGMLAHELRNPLAPLRNAVDILEMDEISDELVKDARGVIDRQVRHMTRLVDDLLDATRIARGKVLLRKERCDLCAVVRQTAADYRNLFQDDHLQFELDAPEGPHYVHGDPTRLAQSVGNLLHNAHKFTDAGGSVTVQLRVDEGNGWARIDVKDTGVGIEPAMLPYVFDVFRQADQGLDRSRGGLGLGLTLVKGLVELHGGSVEAGSEGPGKGAQFTVRLPLQSNTAAMTVVKGEPAKTIVRKLRVLVIDDNRDAAETIKLLLLRDGHQVSTAYTGPSGLERVQSFQPQVIICDIGLPGMDGYQVARSVLQNHTEGPMHLIALTGYGREEDQARAREAGFVVHMTKPIDFSALRQVLTTVVDGTAS